jgi:hypothetical protein
MTNRVRPVIRTRSRPVADPTKMNNAAAAATARADSQPRTRAPLTGVASRSNPLRKSKTSLSILAPEWRMTIARKARIKRPAKRGTPPMTTASDVPKTTGMVEAGQDHGRSATSHFLRRGILAETFGGMPGLYHSRGGSVNFCQAFLARIFLTRSTHSDDRAGMWMTSSQDKLFSLCWSTFSYCSFRKITAVSLKAGLFLMNSQTS